MQHVFRHENQDMKDQFEYIQIGHGTAKGDDSYLMGTEAARAAMKDIHVDRISAVLVFASVRYDLNQLLAGIAEVVGDVPIFGSTTAGEIYHEPLRESVVVTVLTSPYLSVRLGVGRNVTTNWLSAVKEAVATAEIQPFFSNNDNDIWSEMTIQGKSLFALIFSPGNSKHADSRGFEILEELKRLSLGRIPFFGGCSADDWRMETSYVLCGREAFPDSLLVALFETNLRFGISMDHGFSPSDRRAVATRVRSHEILELDNKKASDVYAQLLGSHVDALKGKHLTLSSGKLCGMHDMLDQYRLSVASYFTPDGGVRFSQPLSDNTTITIMEAEFDYFVKAGRETLRKAIVRGQISRPAVAIVFPCALRKVIIKDSYSSEIKIMRSLVPDLPIIGFYSFGEVGVTDAGMSVHSNASITVLVLGDELSASAMVAFENKRILMEQKKSEAFIDSLLENIPNMIFVKDVRDLRFVRFNRAGEKLLGYSKEDLIGKNDYDLFPKEMADYYTGKDREVITRGVLLDIPEESIQTRTIGDRLLHTKKIPLFDENGRPEYLMGFSEDITDRKQVEEALKASEEKYRRLAENSPDMIYRVSIPGGAYEYVSPAAEVITGYSPEEWYENPLLMKEILHPAWNDYFETEWRKLLEGHVSLSFEYQVVHKDKSTRWVNQRNVVLRNEAGDLIAVEGILTDITMRKEAEENDRVSQERFLKVLDSIDAAVYVADLETYEILFVNQYMKDRCGRDTTGEICWEAFRNATEPCKHCTDIRLVDSNGNPTGVCVWKDKNANTGKYYVNRDRAIEWTNGRLVRLRISTDVSEITKMEEQLQQAQKMEAIGRLAGGVAHDFNNMLTIITGNTEMILEDTKPGDPAISNLWEIKRAAQRSTDLTRQLLAFARKQTVAPKVIDLNQTIDGMLKMLQRLIGEDIDLAWTPNPDLWLVKIDPSQVDQVLANLFANARDAIQGVGKVTIETDNVSLDVDFCLKHEGFRPGDYVMIGVSDSGAGMDRETIENVFEPFFTTKDFGKGTGLGLATVYGIVKQNNGFINVYSEVERGTTFKLYFPKYILKDMQERKEYVFEKEAGGGETILLVEDERGILKMTTMMLEHLGYKVLPASGPAEAIDIGKSYPGQIQILVTDVVMPEMSGRDVAKKLMQFYPDIKCLFMSGYTANVIADRGVLDEGVYFLSKPFSMRDLSTKISELLDET
jgi:PAS domain S-box-containing protein